MERRRLHGRCQACGKLGPLTICSVCHASVCVNCLEGVGCRLCHGGVMR